MAQYMINIELYMLIFICLFGCLIYGLRKTIVNIIKSKSKFSSNNFYAPNFVTFNFLNVGTLRSIKPIKHHVKSCQEKRKTK